jgi:hypothetical protein
MHKALSAGKGEIRLLSVLGLLLVIIVIVGETISASGLETNIKLI